MHFYGFKECEKGILPVTSDLGIPSSHSHPPIPTPQGKTKQNNQQVICFWFLVYLSMCT